MCAPGRPPQGRERERERERRRDRLCVWNILHDTELNEKGGKKKKKLWEKGGGVCLFWYHQDGFKPPVLTLLLSRTQVTSHLPPVLLLLLPPGPGFFWKDGGRRRIRGAFRKFCQGSLSIPSTAPATTISLFSSASASRDAKRNFQQQEEESPFFSLSRSAG